MTGSAIEQEYLFREAIIESVLRVADLGSGSLSRTQLEQFEFQGQRYRLLDAQGGIWNPTASGTATWPRPGLVATMSIATTLKSPYNDEELDDGVWRYKYQAGGAAGKNTKLRRAMEFKLPVLWLKQISSSMYVPYKVFIVADDPADYSCSISPDLELYRRATAGSPIEKSYAIRETKFRRHQRQFRAEVLSAYKCKCAICSLRHEALLEAAHITPDSDPSSTAQVSNGLSLCRIHHGAYDVNIIGIDAEYRVHVSESILQEVDGPMLQHGIKEMQGRQLWVPDRAGDRPDRDRLSVRFQGFLAATA